jgi:restriction endonuclease S subunit
MAVISIVNLADLGGAKRIDADFYKPEYHIDFTKGDWQPIKKFLSDCQYGISQAMTEEQKGYSIFRMDDIKNCFLLNAEVKYVEISESLFRQFKLDVDDVLFNRVNSEEFVGRTGIFKLKGDYVFASYLIRLKVKTNSQILPDYLNIFLNTKFGKKQIHRFSRRAVNQANVNAEELKNFRICLIPRNVQEKVCQLANEAWNNVELSKSQYIKAQSTLSDELGLRDYKPKYALSYVGDLSEAFGMQRVDAEYFQPAYDEVTEKVLSYPNGYAKLLDYVQDVKANFEPSKYSDKIFSYVELADIDSSIGVIDSATEIKGEEAPSRARRILKENDVIVSSVEGSLEKVALVDKAHQYNLASTGFFQLRAIKIPAEVLLILSKSIILQMQLKRECSGTILTAVPNDALKKIVIPILPDKIQKKIAALVQQSHEARRKSTELLEEAKRKVEEAIEKAK